MSRGAALLRYHQPMRCRFFIALETNLLVPSHRYLSDSRIVIGTDKNA